jgi:adenosylcobinamide-phosphate synthase
MASGAGALGISLGGAATYEGKVEQRPVLGAGPAAGACDILRAWRLVFRTALLWSAAALVIGTVFHLICT